MDMITLTKEEGQSIRKLSSIFGIFTILAFSNRFFVAPDNKLLFSLNFVYKASKDDDNFVNVYRIFLSHR